MLNVTGRYRQSHTSRIIHNVLDVLQPYEQHDLGWREWPDHVFYQGEDGVARSVRELWGDHPPRAIRVFDRMMQFAGNGSIRNAMRAAEKTARVITDHRSPCWDCFERDKMSNSRLGVAACPSEFSPI